MNINFLGATETVTGSKTLLNIDKLNIMVDCGMYQGDKKTQKLNLAELSFDVTELD